MTPQHDQHPAEDLRPLTEIARDLHRQLDDAVEQRGAFVGHLEVDGARAIRELAAALRDVNSLIPTDVHVGPMPPADMYTSAEVWNACTDAGHSTANADAVVAKLTPGPRDIPGRVG